MLCSSLFNLTMPMKPTPTSRRKFTEEEDKTLRSLVETFGNKNWEFIAMYMPGRTGRQCRDRYRNYLVPGLFNGQWSPEEDNLLHQKFEELGPQWSRMMSYFPGRSANALKNRYNYFVLPQLASQDVKSPPSVASSPETPVVVEENTHQELFDFTPDVSDEFWDSVDLSYENPFGYFVV